MTIVTLNNKITTKTNYLAVVIPQETEKEIKNGHILPTGQWYAKSAVNHSANSAYSAYPAYSAHPAYSA